MKRAGFICMLLCGISLSQFVTVSAGDWPTWRHDAERSGATTDQLPAELHLQWTLQLPPTEPAWQEDARLQFDASYEPIVAGKRMYIASPNNDSLTAYDATSGDEQWKFFAGGPIRFAPVFTGGRLYFGADDGCFYCVNAESGKQIWKYDAAPSNRKVIGNGRLASVWPMRGGPVLRDGKIYFTVGVWPFEGVLLYTLDLNSAKDAEGRPQFTSRTLKDVAPQGYAIATDANLFFPCGRAKVAAMERNSGKPVGLNYDSRGKTDYHAIAVGDWMFHGNAIYNVKEKLLASVAASSPVIDGNIAYAGQAAKLVAYDLANPQFTETKDRRGRPVKRLSLAKKWELAVNENPGKTKEESAKWAAEHPLRVFLKAGNRLYGYQSGNLFAVDLPSDDNPAKVVWSYPLEGTPTSMLAADDRLFVVTKAGKVLCLGADQVEPRHHQAVPTEIAAAKPAVQGRAAEMLKHAPSDVGYALVMGFNRGDLIGEIIKQSKFPVIAIDRDPMKVDALRRKMDAAGLYGTRISAHVGSPLHFGLPPYLASIITSEDAEAGEFHNPDEILRNIYRILRPYGGTAYLETSDIEHDMLKLLVMGLPKVEVRRVGELSGLTRAGALPNSADWTHEYGDASNTLMSRDKLVKAPLGVLWFGGPAGSGDLFYNRHYWGPSLAVIGGRMFLQGPDKLSAVDIYTGRLLWQVSLNDPSIKGREGRLPGRRGNDFEEIIAGFNFVAVEDGIYLADDRICRRYDPATGEVLSEFTLTEDEGRWGRFRIYEDLLVAEVFRDVEGKGNLPVELRAVNRNSGDLVWKKEAKFSFPFFAINGGKIYAFDGMIEDLYLDWKRRGKIPKAGPDRDLVSLDVRTGEQLWRYTTDMIVTWLSYSQENDVLMVSNNKGMIAYRGKNGKELWRKYSTGKGFAGHPENLWDRVILWKDQVLDQRGPGLAYDIQTGESVKRKHPITGEEIDWEFTKKGHHCNYAIANEHLMTFRAGDAGFCDVSTGTTGRLTGFRSGCRNSLIPAGGVLNAPNMAHGCVCGYSIFTSLALVHVPEAELWTYSPLAKRDEPPKKFAINFGAPGDRVDEQGTMWLDYPNIGGSSPDVNIKLTGENLRYFRNHSEQVEGKGLKWVAASGVEGANEITITIPGRAKEERNYTVRLHFVEPADTSEGHRRFSVSLQGKPVHSDLDIVKQAKGRSRALVEEFTAVPIAGELKIKLEATAGLPVLCGVEIHAEE